MGRRSALLQGHRPFGKYRAVRNCYRYDNAAACHYEAACQPVRRAWQSRDTFRKGTGYGAAIPVVLQESGTDFLQRVEAAYPFIKANDTATNIVKLQVKVDDVVDSFIRREECRAWNSDTETGTRLTVRESTEDPYDLEIVGYIQPVNTIDNILVRERINTAALYNGDG